MATHETSYDYQSNLLGYLLDALDEDARERVASRLETDMELRRQLETLRLRVAPLDELPAPETPADLGFKTMARLDAYLLAADDPQSASAGEVEAVSTVATTAAAGSAKLPQTSAEDQEVPLRDRVGLSSREEAAPRGRRISFIDAVVATGIVLTAALMFFPLLSHRRHQSHVQFCQQNLQRLGLALAQYSDAHRGFLPAIPREPRLAMAGIYSSLLHHGGYGTEASDFVCPAANERQQWEGWQPPTIEELRQASPQHLQLLHQTAGGTYGYQLGYMRDGEYVASRNRQRATFAVVADAPDSHNPQRGSANHGNKGQNVLFEDGHVQFIAESRSDKLDEFYVSDRGLLEPGRHMNDSVIAASWTSPYFD